MRNGLNAILFAFFPSFVSFLTNFQSFVAHSVRSTLKNNQKWPKTEGKVIEKTKFTLNPF